MGQYECQGLCKQSPVYYTTVGLKRKLPSDFSLNLGLFSMMFILNGDVKHSWILKVKQIGLFVCIRNQWPLKPYVVYSFALTLHSILCLQFLEDLGVIFGISSSIV